MGGGRLHHSSTLDFGVCVTNGEVGEEGDPLAKTKAHQQNKKPLVRGLGGGRLHFGFWSLCYSELTLFRPGTEN